MAWYSLQTQGTIVATITLHKYIRQEARNGWLFKKYNNDDMIVIYCDGEDEEDEMLAGVVLSHLSNEIRLIGRQSRYFNAEGARVKTCK